MGQVQLEDEVKDAITKDGIHIYPDGRMDVKSASAYSGYSTKSLANMRSKGEGCPFYKSGKVFYKKADMDAWMESLRATSTAQARLNKAQKRKAITGVDNKRGGETSK